MLLERHGESLGAAAAAALTVSDCGRIAMDVLGALEYVHSRGYTHGDIKPGNICRALSDQDRFVLIDFGLAAPYRRLGTAGAHTPYREDPRAKHDGTLMYSCGDQHAGATLSRRGDLEILAYVLVELLGGALPWAEEANAAYTVRPKEKAALQASGTSPMPGLRQRSLAAG